MLITPEENDENQRILNLRQEIIIAEQKVKQLEGAQRQIKGEIQTDLDTKNQILKAIEILASSKESLTKETTQLILERDSLKTENSNLDATNKNHIKEMCDRGDEIDQKRNELSDNISKFEESKKIHDEEVLKLSKDRKEHDDRVSRLLEAIK